MKSTLKSKAKPKAKPATKAKPAAKAKPSARANPKPEAKPKRKAQLKTKTKTKTKLKSESDGVARSASLAALHLSELGIQFALIGGLAVSARTEPRYTRDVDFAVSVETDGQAETILFGMKRSGYIISSVFEQIGAKRLATARLIHRDEPDVFVDLLFASCGIETELVLAAETIEYLPQMTLPVAQAGHLIALKILSESEQRLQDRIDLTALAQIAHPADWALAEEAVRLIKQRGFNRGRALLRRLRKWRSRTPSRHD